VLLPAKKPDFATRRLGVVILVMKNQHDDDGQGSDHSGEGFDGHVRAPIAGQ
jgi:hypothetical protein